MLYIGRHREGRILRCERLMIYSFEIRDFLRIFIYMTDTEKQ